MNHICGPVSKAHEISCILETRINLVSKSILKTNLPPSSKLFDDNSSKKGNIMTPLFIFLFACAHNSAVTSIVDRRGDIDFDVLEQAIDEQIGDDIDICYINAFVENPNIPETMKVYFTIVASSGEVVHPTTRYFGEDAPPDSLSRCMDKTFRSLQLAPTNTFGGVWYIVESPFSN